MADPFKQALRQTLRGIRENLSVAYRQKSSAQVCARIKKLNQYRYAKRIALYHPARGEIDLGAIWQSAPLQGKFCYFPAITPEKSLSFLPATPATPFRKNPYGIAEPDVELSKAIKPEDLDLIFVPLVGFDEQGTRLGMGAGYYDRTFAQKKHPLLIGVAYEFQRQFFIVPHEWDIPLQAVITPTTTYWCHPQI